MSDRPPQSLKDLVERVPDGEARLALQALTREVERLKGEVAGRDRALDSVREYLKKAFSMTFDGWCDAFEAGSPGLPTIVGGATGQGATSAQAPRPTAEPGGTRVAMAQAQAEGNFLEFCRRAFLVLEGSVASFVSDGLVADVLAIKTAWQRQQQERQERTKQAKERNAKKGQDVSGWEDYDPKPLNIDPKRNAFRDLLEAVFVLLYGDDFLNAKPWEPTPSYERYWVLTHVKGVRDAASHAGGSGLSFRNSNTREFYAGRDYASVREALDVLEGDLAEYRKGWQD